MGLDLEKRIQNLENELKALKATYSVYGGAMKTYASISPTYSWSWTIPPVIPVVRFTSDWVRDKNILVASVNVEMWDENGVLIRSPVELSLDIQNKNGSVDIHLLPDPLMETFRISLYSTSPGTFTRIN